MTQPNHNPEPTTRTAAAANEPAYYNYQQPLNYNNNNYQANYYTPANYYQQQQQPYQQPLNYNIPPPPLYQQQQPYLPHPPPPPQQQQQQQPIYNSSPLRPHHHHHHNNNNKSSAYSPQTTPFGSPKPHHHWKNPRHHIRSPASQPHSSPRHPPPLFSPRSPYSSTSSPSTQGPQSPASSLPPISHHHQQHQQQHHHHQQQQQPLLRGSLAQAKLRGHPIPTSSFKPEHIPFASLSLQHTPPPPPHHHHHHHHHHNKTALPKPPIHSQHALWVGNIPNDASHEELWKFFSAQPIITTPTFKQPSTPITPAGVESIHLIARSNCAFVNYLSQAHLNQAITACNGKPLRPLDPYCKPLLCRIRKPEDNIKSGVGAQRIGGLHRSWVKRSSDHPPSSHHHNHFNKHRHTLPSSSTTSTENTKNQHNNNNIQQQQQQHSNSLNEPSTTNLRTSSTLTAASNQSQSTTSSFLASHFPRRYFILKAYTDEDLRISVDRSIWVSQAHNEPILDQAYRTSAEGVFLIFSANQSGSFFGYARMAGPIAGVRGRRQSLPPASPPTEASIKGAAGRTRSASIGTPDRALEGLFVDLPPSASPRALSPVLPELPLRWPGSPVRRSLPILGPPRTPQSVLQPSSTISNTTTPTPLKDPHSNTTLPFTSPLLSHEHHQLIPADHSAQIHVQDRHQQLGPSTNDYIHTGGDDDDDEDEDDEDKLMSGKPFKVEWIRVQKLSFYRTKNLRNPFNGNREVKVSRDGTEVEPSIGAAIVAEIENEFNRHHHPHQQLQQQQPIQQDQHHHPQSSSSSSGLPTLQGQHFQT